MATLSIIIFHFRYYFTVLILLTGTVFAQGGDDFYKNGSYDTAIPTPESILGFKIGERPLRYHEAVSYLRTLAGASTKMQLFESGETHEGRALYYALISDESNMSRLEEIRSDIALLADPRKSGSRAEEIIKTSPAIAWMMYSVHGDELSGADASVQLAYQLVAGTDERTRALRKSLVIAIDPMENPDGRERILAQLQQWNGNILNSDLQALAHSGVWPWGRTNHYLFDLNRDWFILSQPESRARVAAINKWNPQLIIDAHEMGAFSSFVFPPSREPINHNYSPLMERWIERYAQDHAAAFDEYGWSYYNREWLEDWYPGYGSSMPFLRGAVGILYEQAATDGSVIKRPDGTYVTFRDAVHHQFIGSISNLSTTAKNREELLSDFYAARKEASQSNPRTPVRAYYIVPGENASRVERLIERLLWQGIEVHQLTKEQRGVELQDYWTAGKAKRNLPAGTYLLRMDQPLSPLIHAILEFDPRMTTAFLNSERESLEKGEGTRLYEVSGWSMLMAYDVEAYAATRSSSSTAEMIAAITKPAGKVLNPDAGYGYLIDYRDDRAVNALLRLMEAGINVRCAIKSFRTAGESWPRGTLLVRRNENSNSMPSGLAGICRDEGVKAIGVSSARSEEGADLGGDHFELLKPPRIAILAGASVSSYNLGAMWYMLDYELQQRISLLNIEHFSGMDLRKYNVIVMPSGWSGYERTLGKSGVGKLKDWVASGGTLVAIGSAAAFLADSSDGLSSVALRRQVLDKLDTYAKSLELERRVGTTRVDSLALWEGRASQNAAKESTKDAPASDVVEGLDEDQRTFYPRGAIMQVKLDQEHWLNYGLGSRLPVIFSSSYAFMASSPVQTAARFAAADELRLSGLLWPEAKLRWENTAYLTRESKDNGQIILFAYEPNFRSYFYGSGRLLINSLLLGPGMGTNQPVEW